MFVCVFLGEHCVPESHLPSECLTAEMTGAYYREGEQTEEG